MRLYLAIAVLLGLAATPSLAAGPVETNPYAVQGVVMDEQAVSAKVAKDKALLNVQQVALVKLGENLGGDEVSLAFARMNTKEVLPLLKSLSIEQESISPGHYDGTFTVRFLPDRLKPLLQNLGVKLPPEQGPPMMIIPVWMDDKGQMQMWGDNPWRNAWLALNAAQAQIPIVIPLGDAEDQATLTSADVAANDVVKLEALRRRYDVKTMLLATAQPAPGGGIHAHVVGDSPLGKITIDKVYTADSKVVADSATVAAQRFQTLITDKFRSDQAKLTGSPGGPQQMAVAVPFAGPSEWNGLRARILSAPGVVGLDVTSLDAGGAAATLDYNGGVDDLNNAFKAVGLKLLRNGASSTISPL
jgi:Uncharacterized protein conserved in bacteria (DUF2066)